MKIIVNIMKRNNNIMVKLKMINDGIINIDNENYIIKQNIKSNNNDLAITTIIKREREMCDNECVIMA